jgi:hypothetical protein
MNLKQITEAQAIELLNKGVTIYIQSEDTTLAPENINTFMLGADVWPGEMNIYTQGQTPKQYGYTNIFNWIKERVNEPLKFWTFNSKELLNLDYNRTSYTSLKAIQ